MPKLFGIDIAGLVHQNMSKGLLDATLYVPFPGTRTPGSLTAGTNPSETTHTCKGFVDEYGERAAKGQADVVPEREWKVVLIGKSIDPPAVPILGARVQIDGAELTIVGPIEADPALATYTFKARFV